MAWTPDWELPPAPRGDDELYVIALYVEETEEGRKLWNELPEWAKEAWRREYRDG